MFVKMCVNFFYSFQVIYMKHASFNVNLYLNGTELSMLLLSMFVNLYRELIEACHICVRLDLLFPQLSSHLNECL